ncbi:MAG: ATP-binding protein [Candidatus Thorarchaeota archaeon]
MNERNEPGQIEDRMLQKCLTSVKSIVVIVDGAGSVLFMNARAYGVLGFDESEVMARDWFDLTAPVKMRDEMRFVLSNMISGAVDNFEFYNNPVMTKSGKQLTVSWDYTLLRNDDGSPEAVMISGIDISEHVRAEEELTSAIRAARLYIDLMAHDITNQLQAILTGAELLGHSVTDPVNKVVTDTIGDAVHTCISIIRKTRATEDLADVPLVPTDLNESLDCAIQWIEESHDDVVVEAKLDLSEAVTLASSHIVILLRNLLENAVQHNLSSSKWIWVSLQEREDGYEIRISDNGSGIDDKMKYRMSHPVSRIGGVGVHQARQITQRYGGRFSVVDRVPGQPALGAEFRVWFPKSFGPTGGSS